ncbi:MAG: DUF3837 domain-containing protein [Agathobacter sp.]|nr:DUF3837 domain-containing protein [Agathobacter sp.]
MVPSIARQSVIIKCNQQASVLLGNYEFYYLSGLMKKLFDLDLNEDMQPMEMLEGVQSKLDSLSPSNEQEAYLIKLARNFKPGENLDEQMKELFRWGATEEKLWQMHI